MVVTMSLLQKLRQDMVDKDRFVVKGELERRFKEITGMEIHLSDTEYQEHVFPGFKIGVRRRYIKDLMHSFFKYGIDGIYVK